MRQSGRDNGSTVGPHPPPEGAPALSVDNLRAYYLTHYFGVEREVRAVDDISLVVRRNEIYGLAGESSCGKTTFLKTVAAAVRPPLSVIGGSVQYAFLDRDLYALNPAKLSAIRWRRLSYITQGSMNVLNPVRRVRESFIDFAYRHMGLKRRPFFAAVNEHLQRLHLAASVLDAYPHELSGGMKQRVTIALATICRPEFIIADEPTTALDVIVQKDVLAMIREAQQQIGSSMLFVTHDMTVHANIADRLGIMYAGRLVEEAPTADIFANPKHPYTAHLVASLPRIGEQSRKESLSGAPPNLANPPSGCRFHPRCPLAMEVCREASPALTTLAPGRRVACYAASPLVKPSPTAERVAGATHRAERVGLVQ
ncbi:MAG: ABC transporter ATP-binding protein [Hyphomicrobiales bacterium]|nr:ABC transporter ATP-binding protein [Hyphomicrobiales bacterium]